MLHRHPQAFAEGVDPFKPLLHAGKQFDGMAALHQIVPVQCDSLGAARLDHGVHIGQQAVHLVFPAEVVGLLPELRRRIAQAGDKGVVLHIGGTQRFVEIVQQGDNRSLAHIFLSFRIKKRPAGRFLFSYSPV